MHICAKTTEFALILGAILNFTYKLGMYPKFEDSIRFVATKKHMFGHFNRNYITNTGRDITFLCLIGPGRHLEFQGVIAGGKNGNIIFLKLNNPSTYIKRNFAFNKKKKNTKPLFLTFFPRL